MDHIDLEVLTVRQGAELESVYFIIVSSNSLTLSVFVMVSFLTFQKKKTQVSFILDSSVSLKILAAYVCIMKSQYCLEKSCT